MNDPLNTQSRRHFLQLIALTAATARGVAAKSNRPPRILLRSSWQTINIGDIAHTPGVLRLLEDHIPEAEIYLWPSRIDNGVDQPPGLSVEPRAGVVIVNPEADPVKTTHGGYAPRRT